MRLTARCLLASALALPLLAGGCERAREVFGLEKNVPDEFAVVTRAPLSLPPDFGLRAPAPGAARPQEPAVSAAARESLVQTALGGQRTPGRPAAPAVAGGSVAPAALSRGEAAFLAKADAANTDPRIRQLIDREVQVHTDSEKSFVDSLIFWQKAEEPGTIVDPEKEARRLRERTALGDPVNKGDVPTIERRRRGIFEGIFN